MRVSRLVRSVVLAVVTALVTTMTMVQPAAGVPGDDLDVRFGGSLVGNTAYTTTEGEQMLGTLHRVVGTEDQVPGEGVRLSGGKEGLRFTGSRLALGSSGGLINQSFVMETIFTPAADQVAHGTLFSAGGNMSVRYEGGEFTYGYDTNATPPWQRYRQAVAAPTPGQEHTFSLHYIVSADGAVTINAMLDGERLPSVEGPASARIAAGLQATFGFGHEVHAAGPERGFVGSIRAIRVTGTDGSPDVFRYQGAEPPQGPFHVTWDGPLAEAYVPTEYEVAEGAVEREGTASTNRGNLILTGDGGVRFTAEPNVLGGDLLEGPGFVMETSFTPDGRQGDGATIVSLGGDFQVRYEADRIVYGFGDHTESIAAPIVGREAVLSVAWEPGADGGRVVVWLNGVAGPELSVDEFPQTTPGVAGFGAGFVGTMAESRLGLLDGEFTADAFTFQTLAPVEECDPNAPEIMPGNYQEVSTSDCRELILAKAAALRPTPKQANWHEEGLTAFIHFGVNTFYDQEWGHGTEDPARVDPTGDMDPAVWVKQLRDAGFRTVVITLKHHDGFMLWPTRYSDYNISASPWQDGQGDIARDIADAAREYGMKVGFYLSPGDSHAEIQGIYGNGSPRSERTIPTLVEGDDRAGDDTLPTFTYQATDYGEFFLNTLYEVLTQYGEVSEVWFDGATGNTSATEVFDYDAYYDLIYSLQPNANVAVGGRDIRWIGNEHGEARVNEWAGVPISDNRTGRIYTAQPGGPFNQNYGSDDQVVSVVQSGTANRLHWWPAEADMKITPGWFAHPNDVPKSPEVLLGHYERTVGRNSVMLLNVPPTTTGQFADSSVAAIDGFAAERRKSFTLDHAIGATATVEGQQVTALTNGNTRDGHRFTRGKWQPITIDLGAPQSVARVGLSEDILAAGNTVKEFIIEAEVDGEWRQLGGAGTVGAQRIVKLDSPVTAQRWRITVIDARSDYTISDVKLWGQLDADPGKLTEVYLDCSAERAGDGSEARPFNSLEQFRKVELATGAKVHVRAGTDCADADVVFWGYGTDTNPLEVVVWGEGTAPTIGGKALADRFASYVKQGWKVPVEATPEPTPEPTEEPTVEPTPTPTQPTSEPTPKSTPTATVTVTPPPVQPAPQDLYTTPGHHRVNGRDWFTACEPYSQTVRCRTEILATTVVVRDGRFVRTTGWTFNNLTYLPKMTRAQWATNPLGYTNSWVDNGRAWRTECDTAETGRNGCRSWILADVVVAIANPDGGYTFSQRKQWLFNNIVLFA